MENEYTMNITPTRSVAMVLQFGMLISSFALMLAKMNDTSSLGIALLALLLVSSAVTLMTSGAKWKGSLTYYGVASLQWLISVMYALQALTPWRLVQVEIGSWEAVATGGIVFMSAALTFVYLANAKGWDVFE